MTSIIIIILIINTYLIPFYPVKNEIPLDTSEDILSEGISDPEWIASPQF